jgi:hypothetical protein
VVDSIRKSSTKSWRPTSMGITAGGFLRYAGVTGSAGGASRTGGHWGGRTTPL